MTEGLTKRYTQRYSALEVSKLGLPMSHSGQNVIHLQYSFRLDHMGSFV